MMVNMRDLVLRPERLPRLNTRLPMKFRIFPNPTTEFIYIDGVQFCEAKNWIIYDAAGKSLVEGMVDVNEGISIQHLHQGFITSSSRTPVEHPLLPIAF